MNCPICSTSSSNLFAKHGYAILQCPTCHHQFVDLEITESHVQTVYDDSYFHGGGAGYPNYLAEAKLLRDHGNRYAKLIHKYMDTGSMLDIGASAGFILQGFLDFGWRGEGLEPNAQMVSYACRNLGLSVKAGSLENIDVNDSSDRYDLISMIQVIPHFFDLKKALSNADKLTNPNGYWLIETWNRNSFTAKMFGQNWHEYSPPSVLHWFSPQDLEELVAQYGFYKVAVGRPAKWINGAHVKSLVRYKTGQSHFSGLISKLLEIIPDHLAIPYPAEDLFWILFQKSVVVQG